MLFGLPTVSETAGNQLYVYLQRGVYSIHTVFRKPLTTLVCLILVDIYAKKLVQIT